MVFKFVRKEGGQGDVYGLAGIRRSVRLNDLHHIRGEKARR